MIALASARVSCDLMSMQSPSETRDPTKWTLMSNLIHINKYGFSLF